MQTGKARNLPKRSRYYQGLIDLNVLAKGEDYSKLKKSLVIFVCTFDPFGFDQYLYPFEYQCRLNDGSNYFLGDGTWKIFVNTKGRKGDVSDEFKSLMHYITDGEVNDSYTQALEKKVSLINNNEEWKVSYMTWAIKLADERWEGREEGNIITLYDLYCDGDLPLQKAAAKAKMSETDFLKAAKKLKKA